MIWLLDTTVLIGAQRLGSRLRAMSPDDLVVNTITITELWYGCVQSPDPERKRALWSRFIEPFTVLPFDRAAAECHGELRYQLRHPLIGERHVFIAAIALANDFGVVTANHREFKGPGPRRRVLVALVKGRDEIPGCLYAVTLGRNRGALHWYRCSKVAIPL